MSLLNFRFSEAEKLPDSQGTVNLVGVLGTKLLLCLLNA